MFALSKKMENVLKWYMYNSTSDLVFRKIGVLILSYINILKMFFL